MPIKNKILTKDEFLSGVKFSYDVTADIYCLSSQSTRKLYDVTDQYSVKSYGVGEITDHHFDAYTSLFGVPLIVTIMFNRCKIID